MENNIDLTNIEGDGYKSFYQLKVKRVIDILCCVVILPIVILITAIIAMAIKLGD